jgi:hypothetical protein
MARVGARLIAMDLALVAAGAAVLLATSYAGHAGRREAPVPSVERLEALQDAVALWRRAGVRGRILVHFARSIGMGAEGAALSAENYLERAAAEGLIRGVVHVIPDDAWSEVEARLAVRPGTERTDRGFRLWHAGEPILVVPRGALPPLGEPALVLVEGDRWSTAALQAIGAQLAGPLRADVVAWTAGDATRASILEAVHAPR